MLGVKAVYLIHAIKNPMCCLLGLVIGNTFLGYNSLMHFSRARGKHTGISRQQRIFPAGRMHLIKMNGFRIKKKYIKSITTTITRPSFFLTRHPQHGVGMQKATYWGTALCC